LENDQANQLAQIQKEKELSRLAKEKKLEDLKIKKLLAIQKQREEEEEEERRRSEIIRIEQEGQIKLLLEKKKLEEALQQKKDLLKKEKIEYSSFGRRDPFVPLQVASIHESDLKIDQMKLVGIIWDQDDPLAILEHGSESGISITLKEGDTIANAKVAYINHEKITFEILEYGVYRSYTLQLVN